MISDDNFRYLRFSIWSIKISHLVVVGDFWWLEALCRNALGHGNVTSEPHIVLLLQCHLQLFSYLQVCSGLKTSVVQHFRPPKSSKMSHPSSSIHEVITIYDCKFYLFKPWLPLSHSCFCFLVQMSFSYELLFVKLYCHPFGLVNLGNIFKLHTKIISLLLLKLCAILSW